MSALPRLGLLVASTPSERVSRLLRRLRSWCLPQVAEPEEPVAAWLLTSLRAPGAEKVLRANTPVGVWASAAHEVAEVSALGSPVAVIVTEEWSPSGDERVVLCPDGVDARRFLPMTPFVRARWRMRLGLPEHLVVSVGIPDADGVDDEVVPTALALASAVACGERWLVEAMAWGAPCVTDAVSAAAVGADANVEVAVDDPGQLLQAATTLASDDRRAAALGRAARRLVERRHDTSRPPGEVAERLGLLPPTEGLAARVGARLGELWTPPTASVVGRARAAFSNLEVG
ncbi:MAG: hypothetical protein JWP02_96 [Acidimicrobiales bacterium]|nr:hypothetical protein [Acidimicrobiales bacterium]